MTDAPVSRLRHAAREAWQVLRGIVGERAY